MGPLWPGKISLGPLWLRSICLGGGHLLVSVRLGATLRSDGIGVSLTRSVSLGVLAAHVVWLRMDRRKPRNWHSQARPRAMCETSGAAALLLAKEQEGPEPQPGLSILGFPFWQPSAPERPWLRLSGADSAQAE